MCWVTSVQLCTIPWTVAHQAPLPWDSPGKNTGVGCHFLLQGIFPTQGWNPDSLSRAPPGKPLPLLWDIPGPLYKCWHLLKRSDSKGPRIGRSNFRADRQVLEHSGLCDQRKLPAGRLPLSPPGDLPDPGVKPTSPALAGRFFTTVPHGKPLML